MAEMSSPSPDDELLSILLINLRNATATFGEGTPPVESIRTTIADHVRTMEAQGMKTSITNIRNPQAVSGISDKSIAHQAQSAPTFANLAFRPKPQG